MAVQPEDIRLLANQRFRSLLQSRVLGGTAQNALLFTLLILIVDKTSSSVLATILIIAFILPSILFGIPAGAIADIVPKRIILTLGHIGRGVIVLALIIFSDNVGFILLLVFAFSTVGQFFGPAEAATVPGIVRRDQIASANSLMVFTSLLGQVAGTVILGALLFKIAGEIPIFVIAALLFGWGAWIVATVHAGLTEKKDVARTSMGFLDSLREGFRILRTNRRAYLAIAYLAITLTLAKMLVILLPKYTEDVLGIAPEDTVFVAAPGAIGAGVGLLVAPILARLFGSWRVVAVGFVILLLGLMGLGLVVLVKDFVKETLDFGLTFVENEVGVNSVITMTMILAIPIGFAFTLVRVAAGAVMNEEAPEETQGRVFAVQGSLADFLSLLPLLIVGGTADLVGVRATLLAVTISAMLLALYLTFSRRFGPPPQMRPAEVGQPTSS